MTGLIKRLCDAARKKRQQGDDDISELLIAAAREIELLRCNNKGKWNV